MTDTPTSKSVRWIVGGVMFIVIVVILSLAINQRFTTAKSNLPVYAVLRDFTLTNQNNASFSLGDLKGKVWVGDIIFTRCPGPCRRMTKDMARLQDLWPTNAPVRFVSLTSDPEFDTPAVLKRYATEFKADPDRWTFLTGTKQQIVDVAVDGLKLTRVEKSENERESADDLFIHSTIFVIVDKHGQVRASVESDQPDSLAAARNIVDQLLRER